MGNSRHAVKVAMCIDIMVLKGITAWESRQSQESASGRAGLETGPKAPKVASRNIRVYELGHEWKYVPLFQGLCSSLLVYSFSFFLY